VFHVAKLTVYYHTHSIATNDRIARPKRKRDVSSEDAQNSTAPSDTELKEPASKRQSVQHDKANSKVTDNNDDAPIEDEIVLAQINSLMSGPRKDDGSDNSI